MEKFGCYLKFLREATKVSQTQLASKIGVSQRYISQIEISASQPPTIELCKKICKILGLNKEEIQKLMELAATDRFKSNKSNKPFINFLPQFKSASIIENETDTKAEEISYRNKFILQWESESAEPLTESKKELLKTQLLNTLSTKEYNILEIHFIDKYLKLIISLYSPDINIRFISNKLKAQLSSQKWKKEMTITTLDPLTIKSSH